MTLAELKSALGDGGLGTADADLQRSLAAAESDVEGRAPDAPVASKERVTVLLVGLDLAQAPGLRSFSLGTFRVDYNSSQYDRERERLLRSLSRGRGARLLVGGN